MRKSCEVTIESESRIETGTLIFFKKIRSVRQQGGNWKRIFLIKIQTLEGIIEMTAFKIKGQKFYQEI